MVPPSRSSKPRRRRSLGMTNIQSPPQLPAPLPPIPPPTLPAPPLLALQTPPESDRGGGGGGGGGVGELRAPDCNLAALCEHIRAEGFNSGTFSDVMVEAMGSTYRLHRLILSRSSYFRNMLHGPWKEAGAPTVVLHIDDLNVNSEAIAMALAYLYGFHPQLNDNNAFRVLAVASFLDLLGQSEFYDACEGSGLFFVLLLQLNPFGFQHENDIKCTSKHSATHSVYLKYFHLKDLIVFTGGIVASPFTTDGELPCIILEKKGLCFYPDNLISHASLTMNLYYQIKGRNFWNCHFNGTGLIVLTDPTWMVLWPQLQLLTPRRDLI